MKQRDLKIPYLFGIAQLELAEPKTEGLRPVAKAFADNAHQIKSLGLFPLIALSMASRKERFFGAALMRVTGDVKPVGKDHPQAQQIVEAGREIWKGFLASEEAHTEGGTADNIRIALEHIQSVSADPESMITPGIEAWLSAQIVGGWTAFETLTGDLWEAALNAHPLGLSDLKGKGSEGKMIPLNILQRYKFDLSKSMGTVLKEKRSFDRLDDIRDYYREAFFEDNQKITEILENISIDTITAVRNLIVHRGSIVDQRYIDRAKKLPNAPKASVNSQIKLDGEIVAHLVDPTLKLGTQLISAVDDWLLSH